ncbi:MAG TPA: ABC transporter permease [Candidatus Polarisedimenticolia bacterium]|nr:ABC transporter permease [Candidatus Polarisedimenticolia bacterium]
MPKLRLAWKVWQRDADVYRVTWKTNMIPPLAEPLLYLAAFGAGLGAIVETVPYRGAQVSYAAFIAPGLMAVGVMFHAFFENTYSTFVRMHYQKTFDALLATPLGAADIVLGELLWGASKGFFAGALMMAVILLFGLLQLPSALWILPWSLATGLMFASLGMCFTSRVPNIDAFNLPTFLLITPMYLFSGTFFPLEVLPPWARAAAWALPLTHASSVTRGLAFGEPPAAHAASILYVACFTAAASWLSLRWMRRRIIR